MERTDEAVDERDDILEYEAIYEELEAKGEIDEIP
jgi:hypothetical protein